tara:strand:- start:483 stop:722 length:240 start_codon:yes stop_codon:yes gene_type:complete
MKPSQMRVIATQDATARNSGQGLLMERIRRERQGPDRDGGACSAEVPGSGKSKGKLVSSFALLLLKHAVPRTARQPLSE